MPARQWQGCNGVLLRREATQSKTIRAPMISGCLLQRFGLMVNVGPPAPTVASARGLRSDSTLVAGLGLVARLRAENPHIAHADGDAVIDDQHPHVTPFRAWLEMSR